MTTSAEIRSYFPWFEEQDTSEPIVYFDNAATTLKSASVIERLGELYAQGISSVHRGGHRAARESTRRFEAVRENVGQLFGLTTEYDVVICRGATHGLNLVAQGLGQGIVESGDNIVVSGLEHHANLVPWQQVCRRRGANLRVIPLDERGDIDLDAADCLIDSDTRIVALAHVSNVLGTITPVAELADIARRAEAWTVVDGAQSTGHMEVDVPTLGCDFYVCSGHKMLGPTGVGALVGRTEALEGIVPSETGGGMARNVEWTSCDFADLPHRLEAGTPPVGEAVGLGEAVDVLSDFGLDFIARRERELCDHLLEGLEAFEAVSIVGDPRRRAAVVPFVVDGLHAYDVAELLDQQNIAVRAGHHCARPLHRELGLDATVRASLAFYNSHDDIDRFSRAIERTLEFC